MASKWVLMGPLRGDEIAFFDNDIVTLVDMEGQWLLGGGGRRAVPAASTPLIKKNAPEILDVLSCCLYPLQ